MTWFFLLNSDFLMWSILFIKIPSYFSHLWNYGVKFKSKETILIVVQKKKTFCTAGSTKTYENWNSNAQSAGLPSKEILFEKNDDATAICSLPSVRMNGRVVFKKQRVYDGEYAPRNKKTFESKRLLIPWWCWSTSVILSSWVEML